MLLNEGKSSYMMFTNTKQEFATRLNMNGKNLERLKTMKLLGVWLTDDLSFEVNTRELCKRAYSRMNMLTKLKYVGLSI